MKINLKATGLELTPAISDYAHKKTESLTKYLENNEDLVALVEVGKVTRHNKGEDVFRAEIHITGGGYDFYAVSKTSNLYASIDSVKDEIASEITSAKGKKSSLARRGQRMVKSMMKGFFRK